MEWKRWNDRALAESDKPKVLFIKVFWDRNCDLLEKAFEHSGIRQILSRTDAVVVDAEEEPYISARYLISDVPSFVFLTPDGKTVGGGNLADTKTIFKFLVEILALWNTQRDRITKYVAENIKPEVSEPAEKLTEDRFVELAKKYKEVSSRIVRDTFDSSRGFPDRWDSLKFINILWASSYSQDIRKAVFNFYLENSDKVEGGIFKGGERGRRTAKICHENLLFAYLLFRSDKDSKRKVEEILRFVIENFWGEGAGFYSSVKDDEKYYASTRSIREISQKPVQDNRIFSFTNAVAVLALSELVHDFRFVEGILKKTVGVLTDMIDERGNVKILKGREGRIFLRNQSMTALALQKYLSLFSDGSVQSKLEKVISRSLELYGGSFVADTDVTGGFGYLSVPLFDPVANVLLGLALWRGKRRKEALEILSSALHIINSNPVKYAFAIPLWTFVALEVSKEID